MDRATFNVLFLCPDNSTRSIIAEALLNRFGSERFRAFSAAAIEPARQIDPLVVELLRKNSLWTNNFRCKGAQEFCGSPAPRMHFIITLSDIPLKHFFPGDPVMACWHISDPADGGSDEFQRRGALRRTFRELENRVRLFVLLRHGTPEHWTRPESPQPAP